MIESLLVVLVERSEVDCLHDCVELFFSLRVSIGEARHERCRGKNLATQHPRVWPRIVDGKPRICQPACADGDQDPLSGRSVARNQDGLQEPAGSLRCHRAIEENPCQGWNPQSQMHAGAANIFSSDGGRDLNPRTIPAGLTGRTRSDARWASQCQLGPIRIVQGWVFGMWNIGCMVSPLVEDQSSHGLKPVQHVLIATLWRTRSRWWRLRQQGKSSQETQ